MRCDLAHHFTIEKARAWRSAIDIDPPYQRPAGVWTVAHRQRLIDSILNGYDIPKLYLHDLRGEQPTPVYAVIDGKQRLTAIWSFLDDGLPLAPDFSLDPRNRPALPDDVRDPRPGDRWSSLHPAWQRVVRRTELSVVLVRDVHPDGLAELFGRLNDGVPLNPSERRNAIGGDLAALIRERATDPVLPARLAFADDRLAYQAFIARRVASAVRSAADPAPTDADLDELVRGGRGLDAARRAVIEAALDADRARLQAAFDAADPRLHDPVSASAWLDQVAAVPQTAAVGEEVR